MIEKIETTTGFKVQGLYPTSNCCTFFDAAHAKPYLEAYPKNAKFFEEGTKWYKMGKGKRKQAEEHNRLHAKASDQSDLMEEAKTMLGEKYIDTASVQDTLKSVPRGKDGKKRKKDIEQTVKNAKGKEDVLVNSCFVVVVVAVVLTLCISFLCFCVCR